MLGRFDIGTKKEHCKILSITIDAAQGSMMVAPVVLRP
tara:strand:- start:2 stop:115 length:114 start_codon:yes stop_codon:yes gene_type:complete